MVRQKWQCPICEHVYDSPMRVSEVLCPQEHTAADLARTTGKVSDKRGRSGRIVMMLVQGELPTEPKRTRKAVANGKQDHRRS